MIKKEDIEEVRSRADIVDVLSNYVDLKPKGTNYISVCPFLDHNEDTPSFVVSPTKQIYKCFGCGKSGNVYSFLMEYARMPFKEAVRLVAGLVGFTIVEDDGTDADLLTDLLRLHEQATHFTVQEYKGGKHSVEEDLFRKRGLTEKVIEDFKLGQWQGTNDFYNASKEVYEHLSLEKSGLFVTRQDLTTVDTFSGRFTFPLIDLNGRTIGFCATGGTRKPKYLNSADSLIYKKMEYLYGFYQAKDSIIKADCAIVVEGNFDCLSMHKIGFTNVVASCGTALTARHSKLLRRYCKSVVLMFDSDSAGDKAVDSAFAHLYDVGITSYVCSYSKYKDPDEIIQKEPDSVKKYIKNSENWFQHRLIGTNKTISDMATLVKTISEEIENPDRRSLFLDECAHTMGVSRESLTFKRINRRRNTPTPHILNKHYSEALLLSAMIRLGAVKLEVPENLFSVWELRALYKNIIEYDGNESGMYTGLDTDMCKLLSTIIDMSRYEIDYAMVRATIERERHNIRRRVILEKIKEAEEQGKDCTELIIKLEYMI